jgi:hypothetical protein
MTNYESGGQEFESLRARQLNQLLKSCSVRGAFLRWANCGKTSCIDPLADSGGPSVLQLLPLRRPVPLLTRFRQWWSVRALRMIKPWPADHPTPPPRLGGQIARQTCRPIFPIGNPRISQSNLGDAAGSNAAAPRRCQRRAVASPLKNLLMIEVAAPASRAEPVSRGSERRHPRRSAS